MPRRARKLTFAPNPETLVGVLTWDRSKENCLEYVKRCQTTALQRRTQKRLNELLDEQEAAAAQRCPAKLTKRTQSLLLETPD
jgi:hypothetical protein